MSDLLEGMLKIPQTVHVDADRGDASFTEAYNRGRFSTEFGHEPLPVAQLNVAHSPIGTLRGLHAEPWDKYIYVPRGTAHAVLADLRAGSSTFGQVFQHDVDQHLSLFIPRGIANGYQAVTDDVTYVYLTTDIWSPATRYVAAAWDDPELAIDWPITDDRLKLSQKDRTNPSFRAAAAAWAEVVAESTG